jgi:hypothetical protein
VASYLKHVHLSAQEAGKKRRFVLAGTTPNSGRGEVKYPCLSLQVKQALPWLSEGPSDIKLQAHDQWDLSLGCKDGSTYKNQFMFDKI